jgi:hypothetical protein
MAKPPAKAQKKAVPVKKKAGRPRAKHSDPDYKQMSVYVHKDVRNKAKARLFEQGGEFSALVESLADVLAALDAENDEDPEEE